MTRIKQVKLYKKGSASEVLAWTKLNQRAAFVYRFKGKGQRDRARTLAAKICADNGVADFEECDQ